ncbi:MAG: hypothetical protein EXS32_12980 [Opitutus sp.]|nr:hypothetical protein [Opitutus sp.]
MSQESPGQRRKQKSFLTKHRAPGGSRRSAAAAGGEGDGDEAEGSGTGVKFSTRLLPLWDRENWPPPSGLLLVNEVVLSVNLSAAKPLMPVVVKTVQL